MAKATTGKTKRARPIVVPAVDDDDAAAIAVTTSGITGDGRFAIVPGEVNNFDVSWWDG